MHQFCGRDTSDFQLVLLISFFCALGMSGRAGRDVQTRDVASLSLAIRHSMTDLVLAVADEHKTRDLCSGSRYSRTSNSLMDSVIR